MTRKVKWIVSVSAAAVLIYMVPVIVAAASAHGTRGYFYDGKCMGGHEIFTYIEGDGYYSYCPGHRETRREYTIRASGGQWETLKGDGTVAFGFRVQDGDVFRTFLVSTNWIRMERVYSPWRLWIPRLLPQG